MKMVGKAITVATALCRRVCEPRMNPARALTIYAAVFSVFIAWASLRTALNPKPHGVGVQTLALVEVGGALLFAFRRTRWFGLLVLLAVFTAAVAIELHMHELPVRFVFYAASALFVQYLSVQSRSGC
jgi:hypothetical protein